MVTFNEKPYVNASDAEIKLFPALNSFECFQDYFNLTPPIRETQNSIDDQNIEELNSVLHFRENDYHFINVIKPKDIESVYLKTKNLIQKHSGLNKEIEQFPQTSRIQLKIRTHSFQQLYREDFKAFYTGIVTVYNASQPTIKGENKNYPPILDSQAFEIAQSLAQKYTFKKIPLNTGKGGMSESGLEKIKDRILFVKTPTERLHDKQGNEIRKPSPFFFNIENFAINQIPYHPGILFPVAKNFEEYKIYFPYCSGGDLVQKINELGNIDKRKVSFEILMIIKHFHDHNLVHGDIKPENIVFDENNNPYVIDLTSVQPEGGHVIFGTMSYASPEVQRAMKSAMNNQKIPFSQSKKNDIYSLGKLLETLYSYPPYQLQKNEFQLLKDLVNRMLSKIPSARPTIEEALQHEFFRDLSNKDSHTHLQSSLRADSFDISEYETVLPNEFIPVERKDNLENSICFSRAF